MTDHYDK